jgi:hypothetical protein
MGAGGGLQLADGVDALAEDLGAEARKSKRGRRTGVLPGVVMSNRRFGMRIIGARACLRGKVGGVRAWQWAA